jgi:hypothetical protein
MAGGNDIDKPIVRASAQRLLNAQKTIQTWRLI